MELRSWIQETYVPVVMTSTTIEVERISQKNGITFNDMISAFSILENADTPVRTVMHHYNIKDFRMQFIPASQLSSISAPKSNDILNKIVADNYPMDESLSDYPSIHSASDVPAALASLGTAPFPWYGKLRDKIMQTLRCESSDMLHCPAAMLLVVSTLDSDIIHCFRQLGTGQYLPTSFHDGLYDPNITKFYLLLHDVGEATAVDPDVMFQTMKATFPVANCKLLKINSIPMGTPDEGAYDLWTEHPAIKAPLFPEKIRRFPSVSKRFGCLLSSEDIAALRVFVWDLGLKGVLPTLEARMFQLNETVSSVRKGMKNVIKSWWRKPKESMSSSGSKSAAGAYAASSSSIQYKYDSIESQIRLLADSAFMLQDYHLAVSMYRLVREDFKADKAVLHYASCNEMIALCLYMTKSGRSQVASAVDSALSAYTRGLSSHPQTPRLTTRAAILASEIYMTFANDNLHHGGMAEAAAVLLRSSTMTNCSVASALLLERSAMYDLLGKPPRFRKYAFHSVMAGHLYHTFNHPRHAVRCFASASAVYDGQGWSHVEDHISFTLARKFTSLREPGKAIRLYQRLIAAGRQPSRQQSTFLAEFGATADSICCESANQLLLDGLKVPEVVGESAQLFTIENACARELQVSTSWECEESERMANEIIVARKRQKLVESGEGDWFTKQSKPRGNRKTADLPLAHRKRVVTVGEEMIVSVIIKNPLAVDIKLTGLHAFGFFENPGSSALEGIFPPTPTNLECLMKDTESVTVHVSEISLPALAAQQVYLRLRVRSYGFFRILGIRWCILERIWGSFEFKRRGALLHNNRENKATRARAKNDSLLGEIVSPTPWLGVEISGMDKTSLLVGQVITTKLRLVNKGAEILRGLLVNTRSCMVTIGLADGTVARNVGRDGSIIDLEDITLGKDEEVVLPMWIRGDKPGRIRLQLLFRYRACGKHYRSLRHDLSLQFVPSLRLSAFVRPRYENVGEFILAVAVENVRADGDSESDPVTISGIHCISGTWGMETLTPTKHSEVLGFRDSTLQHFRVYPKQDVRWSTERGKLLDVSDAAVRFLAMEHAHSLAQEHHRREMEAKKAKPGDSFSLTIQSVRRSNTNKTEECTSELAAIPLVAPTSVDSLLSTSDIHLLVEWRTAAGIRGQTHNRCIRVGASKQGHACPLSITLTHPSESVLSSTTGVVEVDVLLKMRNSGEKEELSFIVETFQVEEEAKYGRKHGGSPEDARQQPQHSFCWAGCTRKLVSNVQVREERQLSLKACFSHVGVYDLNRFRFIMKRDKDDKGTMFIFPNQYPLSVIDAAS